MTRRGMWIRISLAAVVLAALFASAAAIQVRWRRHQARVKEQALGAAERELIERYRAAYVNGKSVEFDSTAWKLAARAGKPEYRRTMLQSALTIPLRGKSKSEVEAIFGLPGDNYATPWTYSLGEDWSPAFGPERFIVYVDFREDAVTAFGYMDY